MGTLNFLSYLDIRFLTTLAPDVSFLKLLSSALNPIKSFTNFHFDLAVPKSAFNPFLKEPRPCLLVLNIVFWIRIPRSDTS
jgi:hypothetical protein